MNHRKSEVMLTYGQHFEVFRFLSSLLGIFSLQFEILLEFRVEFAL